MPRRYLSTGSPHTPRRRVRRARSAPFRRSNGYMPLTNHITGQASSSYGSRDPYGNMVYRCKQNLPDTYVASSTTAVFGAYNYTAAALDNASGFASVFDQYRIDRIQTTFRPMNVATPLVNTASSGFIAPIIYTVIDYDDSTTPTTVAQLRDYQNCSSHLYDPFTLDFKPHVAMNVGGSLSGNIVGPWIDWATPSIQHFGVKLGIPAGTAGFEQQWTVSIVMYISQRNIH
jgi:hypothetical protein